MVMWLTIGENWVKKSSRDLPSNEVGVLRASLISRFTTLKPLQKYNETA